MQNHHKWPNQQFGTFLKTGKLSNGEVKVYNQEASMNVNTEHLQQDANHCNAWACMAAITEGKTKDKITYQQAATESSCSEGLAKRVRGENLVFGEIHGFQMLGSYCHFIQVFKKNHYVYNYVSLSIYFGSLKMGDYSMCKMAVIPKWFMQYFC